MKLPIRPELAGAEPYGAPQLDVPVRLNVNENPYPPSEAAIADMADAVSKIAGEYNRYPDRDARGLRSKLAGYLNTTEPVSLGPENVWVGNGSNEVITHLLQAYAGPGRSMVVPTPSYSMYPEYARNTHTEYVSVARDAEFAVDVAATVQRVRDTGATVVLLATPNNPTGTVVPPADIRQLAEELQPESALLIVDEAYQEFAATPSAITMLTQLENLVVSRTMSKAFALAGGRLGYLAASPQVVDACRIVRLPYHLSSANQAIASVALDHADEMLAQVAELRETSQKLQVDLARLGCEVVASGANFCLFGRFADRHTVWQRLLERGVLVREVGPQGYLRVSAGTPVETDAFLAALTEVLEMKGTAANA